MCVTLIGVHPPKLGHLRPDLLALVKEVELRFTLHVFLEREFRARKQTNRNAWLSDSSETTGDRPVELGRHQLVANLCGSGCDKIQTVVTHRWCSSPAYSRNAPLLARTSLQRTRRIGGFEALQGWRGHSSRHSPGFLRSSYASSALVATRSADPVRLIALIGLCWYGHTRPDACALETPASIEEVQVIWHRKRLQMWHSFSIR